MKLNKFYRLLVLGSALLLQEACGSGDGTTGGTTAAEGSPSGGSSGAGGSSNGATSSGVASSTNGASGTASGTATGEGAVSYTHLDVYKRQAQSQGHRAIEVTTAMSGMAR